MQLPSLLQLLTGRTTAAAAAVAAAAWRGASSPCFQLVQAAQELVALLPRLRPHHRLVGGVMDYAGLRAAHCTHRSAAKRYPINSRLATVCRGHCKQGNKAVAQSAHHCCVMPYAFSALAPLAATGQPGRQALTREVAIQALLSLAVPLHRQRGPRVAVVPAAVWDGEKRRIRVRPPTAAWLQNAQVAYAVVCIPGYHLGCLACSVGCLSHSNTSTAQGMPTPFHPHLQCYSPAKEVLFRCAVHKSQLGVPL